MRTVRMHEAKTHFSALIREVELGGEVVVYRGSEPVAKLVPFTAPHPRAPGALKGQIHLSPDFDEPLEDFAEYR